MVVVDLTMHPVNDASLTPNPNPFSLAGGTHTTARTAVVSTFSGDTDEGDAGVKVGFDSGEYKAIIYGRLPEKKDALGETGDANANIVGMKLNLVSVVLLNQSLSPLLIVIKCSLFIYFLSKNIFFLYSSNNALFS